MNKLVIGIVVGIVVIGIAFIMRSPKSEVSDQTNDPNTSATSVSTVATQTVPPTTTEAQDNTVRYTTDGFEPASMSITPGTTVTFTNTSDQLVWIGSDPHPSHTKLPGFDSLKTLANGQSYQFKFEKAGSWSYHNHLSPNITGTVIVK